MPQQIPHHQLKTPDGVALEPLDNWVFGEHREKKTVQLGYYLVNVDLVCTTGVALYKFH